MKILKVLIVIWLAAQLSGWVRGGENISLLETLPFVQRQASLSADYELLALAAVVMGTWGMLTLHQRPPRPPMPPGPPATPQFRASLLLIPLAVVAMVFLGRRLALSVRFEDAVGLTSHTLANRHLALLCTAMLAMVVIYRIVRTR